MLTPRDVGAFVLVSVLCLNPSIRGVAAEEGPAAQPAAPTTTAAPGDVVTTTPPAAPPEAPAPVKEEPAWPSDFFKSLLFSGYLEMSYVYNFASPSPPSGSENVGRIFDRFSNEFSLNAFLLDVERPVDEDHLVGFKLTPFAGQDAEVTQAFGLFKHLETVDTDGDGVLDTEVEASDTNFDLLNAYIQGYVPWTGTKVQLGKMETTVGAEVIRGPANDNFSRSFLFGFAIPFTHMGLMLTQPVLSRDGGGQLIALGAGISNGWDNVKDRNDAKLIHGVLYLTPCDEFALTANYLYSFSEQPENDSNPRQLVDLVATIKPIPGYQDLKFVLNFDWAGEQGAGLGGGYAQWYGFAGIVRQDFGLFERDKKNWYVAVRGEYFNDADGARTAGFGAGPSDLALWEMTFTLGYKPLDCLLLRTEVRYDKADADVFFEDSGAPGGVPDDSHQTTLAFEASFLF